MIDMESPPRVGVLVVEADFRIPVSPSASTRFRKAANRLPIAAEKFGIPLTPLDYLLHDNRTGLDLNQKVGRSYAGIFEFGFSKMTSDGFKAIVGSVKSWRAYSWCESTSMMIADWVELPDAPKQKEGVK